MGARRMTFAGTYPIAGSRKMVRPLSSAPSTPPPPSSATHNPPTMPSASSSLTPPSSRPVCTFLPSAKFSPHYYQSSGLFEKRLASWRLLRLVTRLAFLPGFFVLFLAMLALVSYRFSTLSTATFSVTEMNPVDAAPPPIRPAPGAVHVHSPYPDAAAAASDPAAHSRHIAVASGIRTGAQAPVSSAAAPQEAGSTRRSSVSASTVAGAKSCEWGKYARWPFVESPTALSPYRRKLLYIKTPKSSSSTVAHILQRYTTRERMVVGYPDFAKDVYTLLDESYAQTAKRLARVPANGHLDAFVSHMVYNSTWVNTALGTQRPFRVTSLREPVARSWSMFLHGKEWNISTFSFGASDPWSFAKNVEVDGQSSYMAGFGNGLDMNNPKQVADHYDHFVLSHRVVESVATLGPKLGLRADDLLFFSQKTSMSSKKPRDIVTPEQKADVDRQLRMKTRHDRAIFEIANQRLDRELAALAPQVRAIVKDVPIMAAQVKKVCGHIDPEDNSCLAKGEIVWDGNSVCVARCIAKWADTHIRCAQ